MINHTYSPAFQQFERKLTYPKQTEKKQPKEIKKNINTKAIIGATIGTVIPLTVLLKNQKVKNPLKLEYGLKDVLFLSGSSITGGMLGGMYKEKKESKKNIFKEGVFQLLNASLPAIGVAGMLKICQKHKKLNNAPVKFVAAMSGIALGMFSAIKSVNKIFNSDKKHYDRKLSPKDYIVCADDAIGALALAKFPVVKSLQLDKALPLVFGYCGYRAGNTE